MHRFLDIAVPAPLRKTFHYLAPEDFPATIEPGCRLRVPFGNKHVNGMLVGYSETTAAPNKIKRAEKLLDLEPILPKTVLDMCLWAADYYHHPIGDVFTTAIPTLLRQGRSAVLENDRLVLTGTCAIAIDTTRESLRNAPKQNSVIDLILASPTGPDRQQLRQAGISTGVVRALQEKGVVQWQTTADQSDDFTLHNVDYQGISPTGEQSDAINAIHDHGTFLLQGITGSGKTEVYLRVIEQMLREHRQALVLVPEIGLTPQTVTRFESRFDVPVVLIHSGLTNGERLSAWRMAASGRAGIIIGTRSAVFTPLARPGVIIVDEEHDTSFKQHEGFKYSARDLSVFRGNLEKIPVILGSATPSVESLQNVRTGKYSHVVLSRRPVGVSPEQYQIVSLRHQHSPGGFSKPVVNLIQQNIDAGGQVLIFLNRRGFAPVFLCPECHWIAACRRCDARMTYHLTNERLICHHCASESPVPSGCAQCGNQELLLLGLGTQRIEQQLRQLFHNTRIIRIDRDTTRRKGTMASMLNELADGEPAILIGTQMVAKGHHFTNVTLSVILDLDSSFYSADFKAIERMGQLVLQVGGRSGRSKKTGVVVIQTHFPNQPLLKLLVDEGYNAFADTILEDRRKNNLPPFYHQALIRAESPSRSLAKDFLEEVSAPDFQNPSVDVLGPIPSSMEKRAGRYRALLLISSESRRALHQELGKRIKHAETCRLSNKVRWTVDVDPIDLF